MMQITGEVFELHKGRKPANCFCHARDGCNFETDRFINDYYGASFRPAAPACSINVLLLSAVRQHSVSAIALRLWKSQEQEGSEDHLI